MSTKKNNNRKKGSKKNTVVTNKAKYVIIKDEDRKKSVKNNKKSKTGNKTVTKQKKCIKTEEIKTPIELVNEKSKASEKHENQKNERVNSGHKTVTSSKKPIKTSNEKAIKFKDKKTEMKKKQTETAVISGHGDVKKAVSSENSKDNTLSIENIRNKWKKKTGVYSAQLAACIALVFVSIAILGSVSLITPNHEAASMSTEGNFYKLTSYDVFVNDIKIATIRDQSEIREAFTKLEDEYKNEYNMDVSLVGKIEYIKSNSLNNEISHIDEIYNNLKSNLVCKAKAYSIYVDDERIGLLKTKEEADELENRVKTFFTKNYEPEEIIEASVDKGVKIIQEDANFNDISNLDELTEYVIIGTDQKRDYTVESGDSYWSIAYNNGMNVDELLSANPEADENYLMPGDVLSLIVPVPLINVNIKRKMIVSEAIPYEVEKTEVSYLYTDQTRIKSAGKKGEAEVEYIVTETNGVVKSKEEVARTVVSEPQTQYVLVGTQAPPLRVGTGTFINPLRGSYITSRFGSRYIFGRTSFHTGLDMAKGYGSTISAADGGTVVFAGYNGSYGYMVEIDHGGGYTTRYAHCSKFYVKKGDKVYQGQAIAAVGSSGVSTGAHCHFEVRKYGVAQNPEKYIY